MKRNRIQSIICIMLASFLLQLTACGTIFYPERRGQKAGEVDIKIAIADGIGLFFFLIPGIAAYIIDFATGAIYLPAGRHNTVELEQHNPFHASLHLPPEILYNQQAVARIVSKEMGLPDTIDWSKLQSVSIAPNQINSYLATAQAVGYAR